MSRGNLCPTHLAIFQLHQHDVILLRTLVPHAMRFGMACIGADLDRSGFNALSFRPCLPFCLRRDQSPGDSDRHGIELVIMKIGRLARRNANVINAHVLILKRSVVKAVFEIVAWRGG